MYTEIPKLVLVHNCIDNSLFIKTHIIIILMHNNVAIVQGCIHTLCVYIG